MNESTIRAPRPLFRNSTLKPLSKNDGIVLMRIGSGYWLATISFRWGKARGLATDVCEALRRARLLLRMSFTSVDRALKTTS